MKNNAENFINKYLGEVEYLISDLYDMQIRDDIRQELLMHLYKLYLGIVSEKYRPLDEKDYVFMCLRRKRDKMSNFFHKSRRNYINYESLDFIPSSENYCENDNDSCSVELEKLMKLHLSDYDQLIMMSYYFEKRTMHEIGINLDISQQAVSKRILKCIEKLKIHY